MNFASRCDGTAMGPCVVRESSGRKAEANRRESCDLFAQSAAIGRASRFGESENHPPPQYDVRCDIAPPTALIALQQATDFICRLDWCVAHSRDLPRFRSCFCFSIWGQTSHVRIFLVLGVHRVACSLPAIAWRLQ
jgi:hypothetical protein